MIWGRFNWHEGREKKANSCHDGENDQFTSSPKSKYNKLLSLVTWGEKCYKSIDKCYTKDNIEYEVIMKEFILNGGLMKHTCNNNDHYLGGDYLLTGKWSMVLANASHVKLDEYFIINLVQNGLKLTVCHHGINHLHLCF